MRKQIATFIWLLGLAVLLLSGNTVTVQASEAGPWTETESTESTEADSSVDTTTYEEMWAPESEVAEVWFESFGVAEWLRIPRIDLTSQVVDVGVVAEEYDVPWLEVGHHFDSVQPGEPGNSVLNGHVDTINSGRIFERLNELEPGDAVYTYSADYRLDWVVVEVYSTPYEDDAFLYDYGETLLTLYTCTGFFNPFTQNYSERFVVHAMLVQAVPRE